MILSLLKNYLWPEVYEASEFRYERIKPVGQVNVGTIAVVAQAAAAPKSGKEIFETVCTACHSTGVLGAPKYGDKPSWEPRIAKGETILIQSALNGFNQMPARGGQPTLSDEEIKATVQYMLAAVSANSNSNTETTSSSEVTGESSPPKKPESGEKPNPTDNNSVGATGESLSPPKPESEEKPNATDNNSALPNTSSLARSSGAD
ncbi:MAG: c-type cytochrome [Thioploca sp.]|nr:c-type cytochrome [Thioploca sp.]